MFEYERRIGMRDVDAAGIVFFARYLSLVHEAYEEMFSTHGVSFRDQLETHSVILPVVHADIDYRLPVMLEDRVKIVLAVSDIKTRSYAVGFKFMGVQGRLAAGGKVVHACVDYTTRKAVSLPAHLVSVLEACARPTDVQP